MLEVVGALAAPVVVGAHVQAPWSGSVIARQAPGTKCGGGMRTVRIAPSANSVY